LARDDAYAFGPGAVVEQTTDPVCNIADLGLSTECSSHLDRAQWLLRRLSFGWGNDKLDAFREATAELGPIVGLSGIRWIGRLIEIHRGSLRLE
jgi:hypothetical protein